MYRFLFIFIAVVSLFSCELLAQENNDLIKVYENFRQQAIRNYDNFRDRANTEYAEFMKKAWQEFHAMPAIPKPKDETIPPVVISDDDKGKHIESKPVPIKDVVDVPQPEPQPQPVGPVKEQPTADRDIIFAFYGTSCNVRVSKDLTLRLDGCDNKTLADAWSMLADKKFDNTLRDCLKLRTKLQLCDWAYLNMLAALAESCVGKGNEAAFLTAFLYCQSGYKMRLGSDGRKLYLLFASKHSIYGIPYFNVDGERFYVYNGKADKMNICGASFPDEQSLSLYITKCQLFAYSKTPERMLKSERYHDMNLTVSVNKNLIDFYNTYPTSNVNGDFMTRWAMYANTPMEKEVADKLYPEMRTRISELSQLGAVNKILNWVQTALVYEYDDKVWGGDRAFFAEESLYYPYCDCEDRSILFTRLVRDLLGLKCILIYYPGHLASAVCFTENVNGDYIMLGGQRFVICDPTYIGASVGMTMPNMDNENASVILLD